MPQIIVRIYRNLDNIKSKLLTIDIEELKEYWNCEVNEGNKLSKWIELMLSNSNSQLPFLKILLNPPSV